MAKCTNCGSDIPGGYKFCRICGTELPPEEAAANIEAAQPDAAPAPDAFTAQTSADQIPAQPAFNAPAEPAFNAPEQPAYSNPSASAFNASAQQAYSAPAQPAYGAPNLQNAYQSAYQPTPQQTYNTQTTVVRTAANDEPGMTWGAFFWTRVLFSIPIVGFVFLLIWSFGGSANRTRVHYARSYLFPGLIIVGIFLVIFIILAIAGSSGDVFREIKRLF